MVKIVVFAGPTAVGKTRYAIEAAKRLGGEIVSADAMQIYRGFDIGSAKPSAEERLEAVHHLIDFADPRTWFSAAEYQRLAREAVLEIADRGRLPILSGGTGLYVSSVIYDLDFSAPPSEGDFRQELAREAREGGTALLHGRLRLLDAEAAARIHPNNLKKLIRALEILHSPYGAGRLRPFSEAFRPWEGCEARIIGLERERAELYGRIESRVDRLMEAGLADEVRGLVADGLSDANISMKGIGYKEILGALRGEYDMDGAVRLIKRNSRRYAKRQMTWFRRYPGIKWFSLSGDGDDALEGIFESLST
jgi:tRNA dimethylallyltransferase